MTHILHCKQGIGPTNLLSTLALTAWVGLGTAGCASSISLDEPNYDSLGAFVEDLPSEPPPVAVDPATILSPKPTTPARASSWALQIDPLEREMVIAQAIMLINTRYRFGGTSATTGFDCSGLVSTVFAKAAPDQAAKLPRTTKQWAAMTQPVDQPQRGDLVFFKIKQPFAHMGIYLGDGQFVHAPSSGGRVRVDSLRTGYFANHYQGARKAFADEAQ